MGIHDFWEGTCDWQEGSPTHAKQNIIAIVFFTVTIVHGFTFNDSPHHGSNITFSSRYVCLFSPVQVFVAPTTIDLQAWRICWSTSSNTTRRSGLDGLGTKTVHTRQSFRFLERPRMGSRHQNCTQEWWWWWRMASVACAGGFGLLASYGILETWRSAWSS